jgi:hypothetical protein
MKKRVWPAAIVALIAALSSGVAAAPQRLPGTAPTGSPRDRTIEDKIRSDEIERVKRDSEKPDARTPDTRFPQIKEDFERIQIINTDILQAHAPDAAPDYKRIAAAASEIRKRAARLKSEMFPVEEERQATDKGKETEEQRELKSLLSALDDAIASFVHNPLFTNLQVVDAHHSTVARRDLERVIKLSARIRKEAERRKKASGG